MTSYPLSWPEGQPRTPSHRRREAQFRQELGRARDDLVRELRRLNARDIVISTNVPTRRDGLPYADMREPSDPGVAVYFNRRRAAPIGAEWRPYVIACDSYRKVKWNLRAVGVTVESLRAIERHGSSAMMEQAFAGFAALPPGASADEPVIEPWWVVLGVHRAATPEEVRRAYVALARTHHPDVGGDVARMARINRAYAEGAANGIGGSR